MERIRDTLEAVFQEILAKKSGATNAGPEEWIRKILTKKELGHIKLQYFRKGILGLSVDSSSWLYNLSLRKESLLNKFKEYSKDIKELRFNIGDLR